ncbi:KR domain-containing protein [Streptomyces sp. GD-15H]|uniref:KR domain-containing protein n=1 Tax=Streptomyces sp. GD-15H TaxID=3129112 RepID=UPI0032459B49
MGGTGFVGRAIGRHLVDRYGAEVVLIGRRGEDDPAVRAALADGRMGYVRGDVTDGWQAREALDAARGLLGDIHGVVFAGAARITGAPVDVADLGEEEFRVHFDVKAAGARHVYEAVADQPLDFLCYLSSAQAFAFGGAGTHPAYAAGVTFADAFARAVGRTAAFPVGVVNWGAWRSSFGDEARNFPMLGFLEDDEGAACFDTAVRLLRAGRYHQVIAMRAPADSADGADRRSEAARETHACRWPTRPARHRPRRTADPRSSGCWWSDSRGRSVCRPVSCRPRWPSPTSGWTPSPVPRSSRRSLRSWAST